MSRLGVLEMCDLLSGPDIVDLRTPVATRSDEASISAESDAANHTLMGQVVNQLNVQSPLHARIEHRMPVIARPLEVRWQLLRVEVGELVADAVQLGSGVLEVDSELHVRVLVLRWRWRGSSNSRRTWEWVGLVLLRRFWSAETSATKTRVAGARGGSGLGCLRAVA